LRLVVVSSNLMLFSRLASLAEAANVDTERADTPADVIPGPADLLVVAWAERDSSWAAQLAGMRRELGMEMVLCGPHTDADARREARASAVGPVIPLSRIADVVRRRLHAASSALA
jgi:hypothetical protein